MERTPVESSNLVSVGFHNEPTETTGTLEVEFRGGKVYQYEGVPVETYESMLAAQSIGSFFGSYIRPYFTGSQV